jgi:hypothetical protein
MREFVGKLPFTSSLNEEVKGNIFLVQRISLEYIFLKSRTF